MSETDILYVTLKCKIETFIYTLFLEVVVHLSNGHRYPQKAKNQQSKAVLLKNIPSPLPISMHVK